MKKEEVNDQELAEKNKESIKQSILDSASQAAAKILDDATAQAKKLRLEAVSDISAQREQNNAKTEKKAKEIALRKSMLTKLDCNQYELEQKQLLVSKVYQEAIIRLKAMTSQQYINFFMTRAAAVAEDGDQIVLSNDEKILDKNWLKKLVDKSGKNLTFSQDTHNEEGGIVLRNKKYDKSLTLSALIKQAREETENEVIKRLFS